MTKLKFREVTRGGYWVRNIETRETDGEYVLQAEIGNHSSHPPSDDKPSKKIDKEIQNQVRYKPRGAK